MNIKTRLFHLLVLVVGVLGLAATLLQKLPKYAAIGAGLALLVADAEKISPSLVAAVKKMFPFLALSVMLVIAALPSCATLSNIKNSCEPTKEDGIQIIADLGLDSWESLLEKYAIQIGVCAVNNAVADFVKNNSPAINVNAKAEDGPALVHGRAWLAKHQGSAQASADAGAA